MYKGYPNRGAYRNAKARADGWASYWHQRQSIAQADRNGYPRSGGFRSRFLAQSRENPSARWRRQFDIGYQSMLAGDLEGARQVAVEMDYEPRDGYEPESLFYYHD